MIDARVCGHSREMDAAAPSEKKKKSRAPIRWRVLIRKTVAILSILGYENVFGRDIEDMNASVASAAWIALLKTLPRLATCSLPSLPTVDEMLRLFKLRKSPLYFIGTYVLGTDEATTEHLFVERQKGRKYVLCDEELMRARLAKLYDVANVVPPDVGALCYHDHEVGVTLGVKNSAGSSREADAVDLLLQWKRRRVDDDPSLKLSLFTRPYA